MTEPDIETTRLTADWTAFDQPVVAITELTADLKNTDPTQLAPLHDTVDGGALNTLLTETESTTPLEIRFTYDGVLVAIDSSGKLEIQLLEEPTE